MLPKNIVGDITDILLYLVLNKGSIVVESVSGLVFICKLDCETAVDGIITEKSILSDGHRENQLH